MPDYPTPLERAFELASSGSYADIPEVKKQMVFEGLSVRQLSGPTLLKQLRAVIEAARSADA